MQATLDLDEVDIDPSTKELLERAVDTLSINGYTAYIVPDDDGNAFGGPWEDEGRIGYVAHWHSRYTLEGHDQEDINNIDWKEEADRKHWTCIPLALYDHGGLYLYEDTKAHWSDPGGWDSGQIGYVYTTPERVRELYCVKALNGAIKKRVLNDLRSYLHQLNCYYQNDIYGYIILDADGEEVESCWGYYPDYVPEGLRGDGLNYLRGELTALMDGMPHSTPIKLTDTPEEDY